MFLEKPAVTAGRRLLITETECASQTDIAIWGDTVQTADYVVSYYVTVRFAPSKLFAVRWFNNLTGEIESVRSFHTMDAAIRDAEASVQCFCSMHPGATSRTVLDPAQDEALISG